MKLAGKHNGCRVTFWKVEIVEWWIRGKKKDG